MKENAGARKKPPVGGLNFLVKDNGKSSVLLMRFKIH